MENKKGTYVSVKVKNKEELYDWFIVQGIDVVPEKELHSTISYSRSEFKRDENKSEIILTKDDYIGIEPLGDEGAIVLKFKSDEMSKRFNECINAGATYDYDTYQPHITITYNGKDLKLSEIKIPDFDIVLHDETVEPLNLNWKEEKINVKDVQLFDKGFNKFEQFIDEQTGFLKINGVIARTGVQDYLALELGDSESDPMSPKGVYRPKDEVLNKDSLESFVNAPITDNHPSEFVNTKNSKELIKGSVSSIETFSKDGIDYIKAKMTITDKSLIDKVLNGKVEISAGYSQDLIKEKGVFQDKAYDYKQTNIKINHVAIVDSGRCGDKCKITADNKAIIKSKNKNERDSMIKYKINDAEVEICDTVFAHINDLKKSLKDAEAEKENVLKDLEKEKVEKEAFKGKSEKLEKDMEEEKKKTADFDITALVNERVALDNVAKDLNVTIDSSFSSMDIKKEIVKSVSNVSLDGKSQEIIDSVYQAVIGATIDKNKEKNKNIEDSHKKAFDGFVPTAPTTTNDAYNKYVENLKNKHKGDK